MSTKQKSYNSHFQEEWLSDPNYKSWLKKYPQDNTKAYCLLCMKVVSVARKGKGGLDEHAKGQKHRSKVPCGDQTLLVGFKSKVIDQKTNDTTTEVPEPDRQQHNLQQTQSSISTFAVGEAVTDAEIYWALEVVMKKHSLNSCGNINNLFQAMFKDSKIAEKFTCGSTKCSYVINFGLAPYFRSLLEDDLKEATFFVSSFDESHNKVIKKGQMDMLVRYWNNSTNLVTTRYYQSEFLGKATAKDVHEKFETCLSSLDPNKMIQVSSDGPNVNLRFLNIIREDRKDKNMKELLEIGTCGLHTVHGALKHGGNASGWAVDKVLSSMYKIFDQSPSRRADYEKISESEVYPLQFCSHRWAENKIVAERAMDVWENVVKTVKFWMGLPKSKQPKEDNKSYQRLKSSINDPLIPVKLRYFSEVADELNKFLVLYQTEKPMVPFLAQSLENMVRSFASTFMLKVNLSAADTCLKLSKIDFKDGSCHKRPADVSLPIPVKIELASLKKQGKVSDSKILQFKSSVVAFLSALCAHLVQKSPMKYPLARNATCFIPSMLVESPETSKRRFGHVLEIMYTSQQLSAKMIKDAKLEFDKFLQENMGLHKEKFLEFDMAENDHRLDAFYFKYLAGKSSFSNFAEVLRMVLTLSHGQASVERGFSVNKSILVENLKTESLIAQRMVNDHMKVHGLETHQIIISPELRRSVKSSRQRYSTFCENERTNTQKSEKSRKRKHIEEEAAEIKRKKCLLSATIRELHQGADEFATKADSSTCFENMKSFLTKSISFRKTAKEKEATIKEYEHRLKQLDKEHLQLNS